MLKVALCHLVRAVARVGINLLVLPLIAGEAFVGLWLLVHAADRPMGLLFAAVFLCAAAALAWGLDRIVTDLDDARMPRLPRRRPRRPTAAQRIQAIFA